MSELSTTSQKIGAAVYKGQEGQPAGEEDQAASEEKEGQEAEFEEEDKSKQENK